MYLTKCKTKTYIFYIAYLLIFIAILFTFATWFVNQQIAHVSLNLAATYPYPIYLFSIIKTFLTVAVLVLVWQHFIDLICQKKLSISRMIICASPLAFIYFISLQFCIILIMFIGGMFFICYGKSIARSIWHNKVDIIVLLIIICWYSFSAHVDLFSPKYWHQALQVLPVEEIPVISPLYKSYLYAKQYNFTNIDYAFWASLIHPINSYNSPLLQLLALIGNFPSLDINSFHLIILGIMFFLAIIGSYGFYLYLKYAFSIRTSISLIGALLFIYGNTFFMTVLALDGPVFLSSYLLLPLALLFITLSVENNNNYLALLTGVVLALPFFILSPHPEMTIYALIVYLIIGFSLCIFSKHFWLSAKLVFLSLFSFFLTSLYHLGPPLIDFYLNNIYVKGHTIFLNHLSTFEPQIDKGPFKYYYFLILYCGSLVLVQQFLKRKMCANAMAWLVIFLLMLWLLFLNKLMAYFPLFNFLKEIPIRINFAYSWRFYLIETIAALILSACAVNMVFDLIEKLFSKLQNSIAIDKINFLIPLIFLFLDIYIISYSVQAFNSNRYPLGDINLLNIKNVKLKKSKHCPYYISLKAKLANYAGLTHDAANLNFLQATLIQFEKDITKKVNNLLILPYQISYQTFLRKFNIKKIATTQPQQLMHIAKLIAPLVDDFYLNNKINCVHPDLTTVFHPYSPARILAYNLDALYYYLPHRFLRIQSATGGDENLGLGAGLFINDSSSTLDNRYVLSMPLFSTLYIGHSDLTIPLPEQYNDLNFMNFNVPLKFYLNRIGSKIADIGGIDIILTKESLPAKLDSHFELISTSLPPNIKDKYYMYINKNSYGMVYLANDIQLSDSQLLKKYIHYILQYQKNNQDQYAAIRYTAVAANLFSQLLNLKKKYDVIIEAPIDFVQQFKTASNPGTIAINNIVGSNAVFEATCKLKSCLFVFNIANVPGWKAYVNYINAPIYRVNFAFMGIKVPQGKSIIWFVYQSYTEFILYCASLIFLLIIFARKFTIKSIG